MSLWRTVYLGGSDLRLDGLRRLVCGRDLAAGGHARRPCWGSERIGGRRALVPGLAALGQVLSSEKSQTIAAFWLVGAAIGAGLAVAGGLSNWQLRPQALRMLRGLAAGSLGGVAGGWLGAMIYQMFSTAGGDGSAGAGRWWLRPVGWMAAGALVGLADGLVVLSPNRIRNGLIGGLAGGLIGGILFDPIKALVAQTAGRGDPTFPFEITSRAAGFVAVGLCIGGAVGLTNLLLKHAWSDRARRRPARPAGDFQRQQPDPGQRPGRRSAVPARSRPEPLAHAPANHPRPGGLVPASERLGSRRCRDHDREERSADHDCAGGPGPKGRHSRE